MKRVVITGLGAVSPNGGTAEEFWHNSINGKSGIGPMTLCDPTNYTCQIAGEIEDFDPTIAIDPKEARRMARFSQLAVVAGKEALTSSGIDIQKLDSYRVGVILGNGNGGFPTLEANSRILAARGGMKMSPFFFPMILPNMATANLSRFIGAQGYSSTAVTACAASNQAIGEAFNVIRSGMADVMFTGGAEAGISELGLGGFAVMKALTTQNAEPAKASRPFDSTRDGFIPAEGSGIIVMEELEHAIKRGARILAEVKGFGCTSDASHLVQPKEDGSAAARAIEIALEDSGIRKKDVDYINAHGTSTPLNDLVETKAIKRAFGEHAYQIPISSTKSMIGHSLGASGSLEAVVCINSITSNMIHPTINYEYPDPECDLDYVPNVARSAPVNVVLSNAFGFGGQNACVVFSGYE
ncbi:MAG: beta-ketoacyl-ACP synthase II [SAR202 cluster bacterium]|nr:beta-ketoacyl-[acyl-carrier-protein] synthase II [Chloroflexota bacterium]MQG26177.1 beta-ketoacyl-ACP synthase II [SAR202 cluster bacterium]MQG52795.1 beta-ketoacyl-ACP synthase II [SAR202 cluster bacterium]|tara:strand:- start:1823 stop:3058 length:1236 start_codon:yes stop_codon:yes gene_type:complete